RGWPRPPRAPPALIADPEAAEAEHAHLHVGIAEPSPFHAVSFLRSLGCDFPPRDGPLVSSEFYAGGKVFRRVAQAMQPIPYRSSLCRRRTSHDLEDRVCRRSRRSF